MTKILKIEGTDIREEIEACHTCPFYSWFDAPPVDVCGIPPAKSEDDERGRELPKSIEKWEINKNGRGYHRLNLIDTECPLPDKEALDAAWRPKNPCPKCSGEMEEDGVYADDDEGGGFDGFGEWTCFECGFKYRPPDKEETQ